MKQTDKITRREYLCALELIDKYNNQKKDNIETIKRSFNSARPNDLMICIFKNKQNEKCLTIGKIYTINKVYYDGDFLYYYCFTDDNGKMKMHIGDKGFFKLI